MRTALFASVFLTLLLHAEPSSADITIKPGPNGHVGIWLVAGPLFGSEQALRFTTQDGSSNEKTVQVSHGATVVPGRSFTLLQAPSGRYDLQKSLRAPENSFALFAGVLRAQTQSRVVLILGTDDGVRVTVDDRVVLDKDLRRPPLHDDDAVEFDLAPGDHPLLIRLRQRSGEWRFAARLLCASDLRPSRTVQFVLPGAEIQHVDLKNLTETTFSLASFSDRYEPSISVSAAGGMPVGVQLPVTAKAVASPGTPNEVPLFQVALGNLPVGTSRVHNFEARLPTIDANQLVHNNVEAPIVFQARIGNQEVQAKRHGHPIVRRALGTIDNALQIAATNITKDNTKNNAAKDNAVSNEKANLVLSTLMLSRSRLEGFLSTGDDDLDASVQEAISSETFAKNVIDSKDPLLEIRGAMRLAYASPLDGNNRPFGVYVPPSLTEGKTYPLVVALHGLNGLPMQFMHIFF